MYLRLVIKYYDLRLSTLDFKKNPLKLNTGCFLGICSCGPVHVRFSLGRIAKSTQLYLHQTSSSQEITLQPQPQDVSGFMAVTLLSSPWVFTGPFKAPVKLRQDIDVIRDTPDWAHPKLKQALFLLLKISEMSLPLTQHREKA